MSDTLPLPEPDTHCWDDDTQSDCWSYSAELVRSIVAAEVAAERERWTEAVMAELDGNGQAQAIVAYVIRTTPCATAPSDGQ